MESAEKLFANGLWKQTLAELYSAFEDLAKNSRYSKPDQQFFASLLAESHPVKKEKAKLALDYLCSFFNWDGTSQAMDLHLAICPFVLPPRDARLGLTLAHAIFEYLTPER